MTECMRPDCVAQVCEYEAQLADTLTKLNDKIDLSLRLEAELARKDKVIDVLLTQRPPKDKITVKQRKQWAEDKAKETDYVYKCETCCFECEFQYLYRITVLTYNQRKWLDKMPELLPKAEMLFNEIAEEGDKYWAFNIEKWLDARNGNTYHVIMRSKQPKYICKCCSNDECHLEDYSAYGIMVICEECGWRMNVEAYEAIKAKENK